MLPPLSPASRVFLLLILVVSPFLLQAQTNAVAQTDLASNNKSITSPPAGKTYDEDARTWYAVYNTGNTVHVYLAITDPQQQRKIVMNGIELWLDAKGKKNKRTGILYPANDMAGKPAMPQQGPPGGRPNFGEHDKADTAGKQELVKSIARHREMTLTGFKPELNGIQNIQHPSGISVSVYFVQDTLVYEACLPLATMPESLAANSRISIGLVEKGMDMPGMGAGMAPPDGGGPGDGMMPPPGPPPGEENGMRIFEDNIIWYKFSLQDAAVTGNK